jgi:predicted membrane channel-forming protein YqfA (hemolysin III family)
MKKISLWAKHHKWTARFIIIISFGLLNIAGITTGMLLDDLNITLPSIVLFFSITLYFAGILFYPLKAEKKKIDPSLFYIKQKSCDIILAASTFVLIVYIGNDRFRSLHYFPTLQAATSSKPVTPADSTFKTYKSLSAFSASLKDENGKSLKWKEKKKLLKEQVRAIKKSGSISKGGKVALIILSVIIALGLVGLVASLACSLSCNGSDAAAVLVGVGGTALVIFLLVLVLRSIAGKKRKKKAIIQEEPVKTE